MSPTRKSGRRASCNLWRAETGGDRFLLAHIRAHLGLAVAAAAAAVIDLRCRIHPHDGVARTTRLGLGFARVLVFARRRRRGSHGHRHAATLGHEYALGLAARLDGRLAGGPFVIALL